MSKKTKIPQGGKISQKTGYCQKLIKVAANFYSVILYREIIAINENTPANM